jgi:sulfatase maturation enzyme AslB (radical SAM superfamily)
MLLPTTIEPETTTSVADRPRRPLAIRGWEFSDAEIESVRRDGRMLMLCTEMSDVCDLRCIYCYRDAQNRPRPDELTPEERLRLVDEAADLGCLSVHIVGAGEPPGHSPVFGGGFL